jgi:hypothetical protein
MKPPIHGRQWAQYLVDGQTPYPVGRIDGDIRADVLNGIHGLTEQQLQEWWDEENNGMTYPVSWETRNDPHKTFNLQRNVLHNYVYQEAWKRVVLPAIKDALLQLIDSLYDGDIDKSGQFIPELVKLSGIPAYAYHDGEQCSNCSETYSLFSATFPDFLVTDHGDRFCDNCLKEAGVVFTDKKETVQL